MKARLVVLSLVLAVCFVAPSAHAAQTTDIQSVINKLMEQIEYLKKLQSQGETVNLGKVIRGNAPEHWYRMKDDAKDGKPKIIITAPKQRASFDKSVSDAIEVTWEAKNIPDNTRVIVELYTVRLEDSGTGGGEWMGEIPEGDSSGSYSWSIQGEGTADAGKYRVRVRVQECHSDGCDLNPDFPGQREHVKVYAKSAWRNITVTDSADTDNGDGDAFATYKATLNGYVVDSATQVTKESAEKRCKEEYNDYERHSFKFGDVLKCYWDGKVFQTVDEWKG